MVRRIDKFIEYFQIIDWTKKRHLIELRAKLVEHGTWLIDNARDLRPEFRNDLEIDIQHQMLRAMITTLDNIINSLND